MKITNNKYILIAIAIIFTMGSCSKDFLDVSPEGVYTDDNYYKTPAQAYAALIAVYDPIRTNSGGFDNMITLMNSGSDDHYAGGGSATDGAGVQGFSNYSIDGNTMPGSFWSTPYQGILRANILLGKLPSIPMSETDKIRYAAEAKGLRAYFYFNLVRMFGHVPLILEPLNASDALNVPQASADDVYAQIEKDLLEAIPVLPVTIPAAEAGRLSKGAVTALLGKVYLYEKKYALSAEQLALVNGVPGTTSPYGYKLLTKFSDLWVVSNKFNSESILEIAHSNKGGSSWNVWGQGVDEGNSVNVMVGPRSYSRPVASPAPNLPSGWSFNPITQDLYDAIKTDPRFAATVLDMKALKAAGEADYIPGYADTGYFTNKFIPTQADVSTGSGDAVLNYQQDTYAIRLADTYLMEAEALGGTGVRAQALLDAVRARVGLASIPVSQDAIANERRLELAGEGHRWFDLVRTGKAATKLASRGFKAGKNEIFPIPVRELENTLIVQNPNY
ncbi:RagB/SusD family nutrient uptake outer membrane protein [Flavobacterium sp. N3904]|uniref:RagB/SusD family nutrient uptake outer membrane protein n=1 Tax=Flavobacterium sp. N3904 TaxID=2986835 RepID=UPI0022249A04|nr:RagB/SusD family nutrient uptake outer membrane protein [Flavobacterium sp. N3904]